MVQAPLPFDSSQEQCIALTADYRLIQKLRGHRYSVDDMLVGHLAATHGPSPARVLDLGCGLGSVLLIMAWRFPKAHCVGLEALAEHVDFSRRNVALNGCEERVQVVQGDLRDDDLLQGLGCFDLVTGSPPYFPKGSGTLCSDAARAAAHFELRGGIEAYALAASHTLTPDGVFVCCAGAEPGGRAEDAVSAAGLSLVYRREVIPREGKAPFLLLLAAKQRCDEDCAFAAPLVLRRGDGSRTVDHIAIREWTGLRVPEGQR